MTDFYFMILIQVLKKKDMSTFHLSQSYAITVDIDGIPIHSKCISMKLESLRVKSNLAASWICFSFVKSPR